MRSLFAGSRRRQAAVVDTQVEVKVRTVRCHSASPGTRNPGTRNLA